MSQRRLPAEIYWRRRLLLLAVLILLVWGAFQLTKGDDARPQADPTPAASPTPKATPVAAEADETVEVSLTSADRPCDPEKIRVIPTVDPGQTTRDTVDVGLVVSSTDTKACTLAPDDADLIAVVSANKTAIWDSRVCKSAVIGQPVELSPRWASLVTTRWSARGSGGSCSSEEAWATPGKFSLQVGTLGGEPGSTTFALEAKQASEETDQKDEKKDDEKDEKKDEKKETAKAED